MKSAVVKVKNSELKMIERNILTTPHASSEKCKGQYESFRILFAGESIVAYTSGKIVSSGPRAEAAVQSAILSLSTDSEKIEMIIGSDEAGKGEWLGPMVIAAVALTPRQSRLLQSLGVMDSKEVSVERIAELAVEVDNNSTARNVVLITPKTFNDKFAELHQEGKNLNDFLAWGHSKAIGAVFSEIQSDTPIRVVVDEFARNKTKQRLSRVIPLDEIILIQRPHAEDEIAVAAAAILAREAREKWIDRYSAENELDLRDLSVPEANQRSDKDLFTKVQYLDKMVKGK